MACLMSPAPLINLAESRVESIRQKQRNAVRRHHRHTLMHYPLGPRQGARTALDPSQERALRSVRRPHPMAGALKALAGFVCAALAMFDVTQPSRPRVALSLAHGPSAETRGGQGLELRGGFHPPPQHGVRGHCAHPGGGPQASALGPARPPMDAHLPRPPVASKPWARGRRTGPLAGRTRARPPGAPAGRAMGPPGAQPQPAAIAPAPRGPKGL